MREIGILFQDDMALATYQDRKTLTSRLRGLERINEAPDEWELCESHGVYSPDVFLFWNGYTHDYAVIKCPYGQPGDVLIGRETWRWICDENSKTCIQYRADGAAVYALAEDEGNGDFCGIGEVVKQQLPTTGPWKSSMLMPWKFSRLRLEVVRVWPSRLQDMTEEMAVQEGCRAIDPKNWGKSFRPLIQKIKDKSAVRAYSELWDEINGKKGHPWASNPWVWRIQFKRL